ncbi:MAG TPA: hypothetical protein DDY43_14260 [Synechococcales bacterium UBA10510]|nr:hypothetical protein [Synechococcales bacterium UBA10510]
MAHRPPQLLARLFQGLARAQVAGQRLGDSMRMGQLHRLHVAHEVALIGRAAWQCSALDSCSVVLGLGHCIQGAAASWPRI